MDSQKSVPTSLAGPGGRLERSSWKAEAIRRGQLKISGPIPWNEGDDESGHQLAKRHTDPSLPPTFELPSQPSQSQSQPHLQAGGPLQQHPPVAADAEPSAGQLHNPEQHTAPQPQPQLQPQQQQQQQQQPQGGEEGSGALQHDHPPPNLRPVSQVQRNTSPNLTTSYHSQTPQPSGTESPPNMTPKKKRRSGLRTAIRKMFGRKSPKDEADGDRGGRETVSPPRQEPPAQNHERQVPELAAKNEDLETVGRGARIFSVPFQELQPRTPLGSHLPFPMNVNAPEEASPPHDYLTFHDGEGPASKVVHRRRATLPSVVFSSADAAALSAYWATDDAHHDHYQHQPVATTDPEIGIAVSSPQHLKRRSRSAGALQDMGRRSSLQGQPTSPTRTPRRRSAEIRYWRNSVYSDSKTVRREEDGKSAVGNTEAAARDTIQLDPDQIRAFNFGNLTSQSQRSSGIERTPTATDHSIASYGDAPYREEQNQTELDQGVPAAPTRSAQQAIILEDAPKGKRASREPSSTPLKGGGSSRTSSTSRGIGVSVPPSSKASGPPSPPLNPTFIGTSSQISSLDPKSSLSDLGISLNYDTMASQPSLGHLRSGPFLDLNNPTEPRLSPDESGAASTPVPGGAIDAPFPTSKAAEQFSAIYTILRHERAARKALEKQVSAMQRELQELRALTTRLATSTSYPTPSPDALQSTEREAGPSGTATSSNRTTILARPPQPRLRTLHRDGDDDAERRQTVTSRFSRYDDDDSGEDENTSGNTSGKTSSPEVYETPREESMPYGFGFGTVQTARAVTVGVGESAAALKF